jgi:hypothetical protein
MLQSDTYADPATIAPINLHNCGSSLLRHLRQQPADALILQLGNYETLASIKRHIRSVLHLSHQKHHSEGDSDEQIDPGTTFLSTPSWRLRVFSKQIYGHSLGHLHPPLFDAVAFRHNAEQLLANLEQLQANAPRLVVFLSPIPCADPLIRRYRHQASQILCDLCRSFSPHLSFRLRYLDTEYALGLDSRNASRNVLRSGIFADDLHLNGKGHQILGDTLAAIMQNDACFAVQENRIPSLQ